MKKNSLIHIEKAQRRLGPDSEALLQNLVRMFLEDMPPLLLELHSAYANRDPNQLWKTAHSLRGMSASIGFQSFADITKEIETIGKEGSIDAATDLLPKLDSLHIQLKAEWGS